MIFSTWGPVFASLALALFSSPLRFALAENTSFNSKVNKPSTPGITAPLSSAPLSEGAYGRILMEETEEEEPEPGLSFDSSLQSTAVDTVDHDSMDMYDYMLLHEGGPGVPPPLPPLAEDQDVPNIENLLNIEREKMRRQGKKVISHKQKEGNNNGNTSEDDKKVTSDEDSDQPGGGTVVAATAGSLIGASVIGAGVYIFKRKRAMTPDVTPAGFDGRFA